MQEVVSVLLRSTTRRIPEESAAYFDDERDDLIRVANVIDIMCDYLMDSLDIYTTQQTRRNAEETNRVSQSMIGLIAVFTIVLPLSLITGTTG